MKVLHITKGMNGGLDNISSKIFKKIPYEQKVLFFSKEGFNIYKKLKKALLLTLSFKGEILFVELFSKIKLLKNYNLIHIHHAKTWVLFSPLVFFGKKTIYSFHQSFGSGIKKSIFENLLIFLIVNYICLFSKKLIFLTFGQKKHIKKYSILKKSFEKKSAVINNFIDKKYIIKNKLNFNKGILFVGRYTQIKGFEDLIQVASTLPDFKFHLIGDNSYNSKLQNMINLGKMDNSKIFKEYDKNSMLILPSYTEAFPMVILEAMARGLVILVSDIPGMSEIVKEGRNGYLFPPGDIEKMKKIISFLKNNPKEIERISKNNLKDIWKFTEEKQMPKYLNAYQEILKNVKK